MTSKHLTNYDDIGRLSAGVYFDLSRIGVYLEKGKYSQAKEVVKSAKDGCYDCLEISRKSIMEINEAKDE